jgi:hypothetical protein
MKVFYGWCFIWQCARPFVNRCMPRDGVAGSLGSFSFSFLRGLYIVLLSGYTNLHRHQQCKGSFSPQPHLHQLLFVLLMTAILTGIRWTLNVNLICISCMAEEIEPFFICLLAIVLLLLRLVYSVHFLTYSMGCGVFDSLVIWAPYMLWLLMVC